LASSVDRVRRRPPNQTSPADYKPCEPPTIHQRTAYDPPANRLQAVCGPTSKPTSDPAAILPAIRQQTGDLRTLPSAGAVGMLRCERRNRRHERRSRRSKRRQVRHRGDGKDSLMIKYKCPYCGNKLETDDSLSRKQETCPACHKVNSVPPSKQDLAEEKKRQDEIRHQEKRRLDEKLQQDAGYFSARAEERSLLAISCG
jgi:rubrerythrin